MSHKFIPCKQCQRRLPVITSSLTKYHNCNQHSQQQIKYQMACLDLSLIFIDGNTLFYGASDEVWLEYNEYRNYVFDKIRRIKIDLENPKVIVGLDAGKSRHRLNLLPSYKAGRTPLPPERKVFVKRVVQELKKEFKALFSQGIEFDDLALLVAKLAVKYNFKLVISTVDKDLLQLVGDNVDWYDHDGRRKVLVNQDNFSDCFIKLWGLNETLKRLNVDFFVGVKVLMGDNGDNIKGFPLLGLKKAVNLIKKHGIPKDWNFNNPELISDVMATNKKYWATIENPVQVIKDLIKFDYKMMDLRIAYPSVFSPQVELELIERFMDIASCMNQKVSDSLLDNFR